MNSSVKPLYDLVLLQHTGGHSTTRTLVQYFLCMMFLEGVGVSLFVSEKICPQTLTLIYTSYSVHIHMYTPCQLLSDAMNFLATLWP